MEHRAPVDMLRFYGGDIRERTKDGKVVFGESSRDAMKTEYWTEDIFMLICV